MADSATLKIVLAEDPSNAKPPSSRPAGGEAPAGTARETAGALPPAGGSGGGAVGGSDAFADLAKSLGLTARELSKKASEPGFAELISQLPKEPSAARESVASSSTGTTREQAARPDTTPIDDAIDEVIERFKKGLLSLEEAQSRLDRFARNEKVVDQLRDAYGGNVDPAEHLRGRLQYAARDRETPTLAKPAQVEILDEKRPTAGGARQAASKSESTGTPGARSLLNELKPLLDQIPGMGRAMAALDKFGPMLGRTAGLSGASAGTARVVAQRVPTAAAGAGEAGAGTARAAATGAGEAGAAEGAAAAGAGEAVAAGGMAELAAVAGPAAVAVIAVKLASDAAAAGINAMRENVKFVGDALTGLARNEIMGTFQAYEEKIASTVEKIPIVGKVFAAEVRLFAETVGTARKVLDAFADRGKELGQYSQTAALAANRQEVAGILADIREANTLGPDYARIIDAQTDIDMEVRDILLEIKKAVLPLVANAAELVSFLLDTFGPMVEGGISGISSAIEVLIELVKNLPGLKSIFDELAKAREQRKKDLDLVDRARNEAAFNAIRKAAATLGREVRSHQPDQTNVRASQVLGIPLLG